MTLAHCKRLNGPVIVTKALLGILGGGVNLAPPFYRGRSRGWERNATYQVGVKQGLREPSPPVPPQCPYPGLGGLRGGCVLPDWVETCTHFRASSPFTH